MDRSRNLLAHWLNGDILEETLVLVEVQVLPGNIHHRGPGALHQAELGRLPSLQLNSFTHLFQCISRLRLDGGCMPNHKGYLSLGGLVKGLSN